jgi:endonuclease/exonuclease/phosphatase family metal-dependent hydrolase
MPPLRFLTLNLWGATPPLSARLGLVREALRELAVDVVALQEVQEIPGELANTAGTLAAAAGLAHLFAPTVPWRRGHEGLAILSRFPIRTHVVRELPHVLSGERRILLSACLAAPAGPLWVHDTHLSYRPQHGLEREAQVLAIADALAACSPENPQILMGDFNARPDADEIRFLKGQTTLGGRRVAMQDAWESVHPLEPGWTWARANAGTAPLAFLGLDRRLDFVFVTQRRRDGRGAILDCRLALDRPDGAGVFASDHFGVLADIQVEPDRTA